MIFNYRDAETQQAKQALTLSYRLWTNLKLILSSSISFQCENKGAHSNYYQRQTSAVNTHRISTSRFNLDPLFLPWLQADSIHLQWETTPTILFTSSFGVTSKTVQIFWLVYNQSDLSEHNYSQRDAMAAMQKLRTELWKISFNHHNYTPDPNPEPKPKSDFTRFKTVIGFHKTRHICTGWQGSIDCKMVKVWQEDCRCSTGPDSQTTAGGDNKCSTSP